MTDDERPGAVPDPSRESSETFDDDADYFTPRRRAGGHSTRDTAITIAVAVVLLAVVAAIVIAGRNKDDNAAPTNTTETTQDGSGDGSSTTPQPLCGNWPENWGFQNTKLEAGKADPGVYVWSGFDGWHLRFVAGSGLTKIFGTLSIESDDLEVEAVGSATADLKGSSATFTVDGGDGKSGFDANISCNTKALRIEVEGPDGLVQLDKLFVGRATRPLANPLIAERETL